MTLERNLQPPSDAAIKRMASQLSSAVAATAVDIPKRKDELIHSRNSPSNVNVLMTSSSDFDFPNR